MDTLEGTTKDVIKDNLEKMKQLFPEVFTENKIMWDRLQQILGENVEYKEERYEFIWNGKGDAIRLSQKQSTGTLRPNKLESLDWEKTKNLYIEGDNLEVLRLLQNSYWGKVKVIYIDPPYNTGNDLIYKDDFSDNVKKYKEENDLYLKSNQQFNGRFHTEWLNMMYPRLKIAKNLLREDGFIFISIDDNEVTNLRKICDEIFGEENFIAQIVWQKRTSPDSRMTISTAHDYILLYGKNAKQAKENILPLEYNSERKESYTNPDNDPRGVWSSGDMTAQVGRAVENQFYEVQTPSGVIYSPPEGRCWSLVESNFKELLKDNRIWFGKDGSSRPRIKKFLSESEGVRPWTWWDNKNYGHNQEGNKELKKLFNNELVFDNPKPTKLIEKILSISTTGKDEEIIMDFFSGSATTAESVIRKNLKDGGNRRFILVQIPEILKDNKLQYQVSSTGLKLGMKTICDIGKQRIRNFVSNLEDIKADVGFKVFQLDDTNLKIWDEDPKNLEMNLLEIQVPIKSDRTNEDVIYEILLKYGVELTVPIEEKQISDRRVYSIGYGYLIICLEIDLTLEEIEKIARECPRRIVFCDGAFKDDIVRTNAEHILKRSGIEDIRVI